MRLYGNKFFVLLLILTISLFFFSAQAVYAGGIIDLAGSLIDAVITVSNTVMNTIIGTAEVYVGTFTPGGGFLVDDGTCRLSHLSGFPGEVYAGRCGGGGGGGLTIMPTSDLSACALVPLTFYNPQMNQTYEYFLGPYSYTDENGYTYNFDSWCQTRLIDETTKQVAIYRFSIPADSSQSTLNDWFINQIQQNVGKGYTDYSGGLYHNSAADQPWETVPYSSVCSGNVCQLNLPAPANSYVAYVAKILADYTEVSPPPPPENGGGGFLWPLKKALAQTVCPAPYSNKFFNKDNAANAIFPDPNIGLGNAIIGPFKTPGCAFTLTVAKAGTGSGTVTTPDLVINCGTTCSKAFDAGTVLAPLTATADTNSVFAGWSNCDSVNASNQCVMTMSTNKTVTANFNLVSPPGTFSLSIAGGGPAACNSVPLSWTSSSGADAYRILKGSPRVDISPYQPYTALNFTDTTVSQNTSYTYQIEAYNSGGSTRSNAINVTTPYCPPVINLSGNSTSIFQGQSITLSWSTNYTSSCSASGNWSGSKSTSGSETVIPSPPPSATYTLTCSGPGGSASQSVTININPLALPNWQEIIPR